MFCDPDCTFLLTFEKENRYTNIVFLDITHCPVLFKRQHFGDWILPPTSGGTYPGGPRQIDLVPISGQLHQHKIEYINKHRTNHLQDLRQILKTLKNSICMRPITRVLSK
jgi:hypothetical protein